MEENFIMGVAIWLCLIDAIDDYNQDVKQKRYNPLLFNGCSNVHNVINERYFVIAKQIMNIYKLIVLKWIITICLRCTSNIIPEQTFIVLKNIKRSVVHMNSI